MQPWNPALIKRRSSLHEPATSSSRTMYFRRWLVWLCSFRPIKSQADGLSSVSVGAIRCRLVALSSRSNDGQTILDRRKAPWVLPQAGRQGRPATLHGVLLGRQRSRTLGGHLPEQEGRRPGVAAGRGEGRRRPIRRSGPREADVPTSWVAGRSGKRQTATPGRLGAATVAFLGPRQPGTGCGQPPGCSRSRSPRATRTGPRC
jgi:hypothetical protein